MLNSSKDEKTKFLHRSNLRGLRLCKSCGNYNGMRALSCKNKSCALAQVKVKKKSISLDTVQLISHTESKLFSVQIREKDTEQRSFVKITDKTISSDEDGCIISRNAICFVDTCKYDSRDINISCKHVKNSLENSVAVAEVLEINSSVWYSMKLGEDSKTIIWDMYNKCQLTTPLVQRINKNTFVVKNDKNFNFPAGRLHLVLTGGDNKSETNYACACKKLKILMSPNNSILLENDKCDHLFLVVAAILSSKQLKEEFKQHIERFNDMIDFENRETILKESYMVTEDFIKFSENILNDVELSNNEFESGYIQITNCNEDELNINQNSSEKNNMLNILSTGLQQTLPLDSIQIVNENMSDDFQSLELSDCQIEFMDQFKLSNDIGICNDDIQFNDQQNFGDGIIFDILSDPVKQENVYLNNNENSMKSSKLNKSKRMLQHKQKIRKSKKQKLNTEQTIINEETKPLDSISFENWMESVIEQMNTTMDFNDDGNPEELIFSIHQGFFNALQNRFSKGLKRRLPSKTSIINNGKLRGLTMFTWIFAHLNGVQNIFKTTNVSLQAERVFSQTSNGEYRYVEHLPESESASGRYRKIRINEYKTYLKLKTSHLPITGDAEDVFIIKWVPNVLKISKYGEMRIHFKFGHKKNNKIICKTKNKI